MSSWKAQDDSPAPAAPRERDPDYHVEELVRRMVEMVPVDAGDDEKESA
jgi:hypothetical protein